MSAPASFAKVGAAPGPVAAGVAASRQPFHFASLVLGPWALEERLHEGALARIYRARPAEADDRAGTYVVKVLHDRLAARPAAVARLRAEAQAGRSAAHRNLISVLSAHIHCPPYYVVLPHRPGVNVGRCLRRFGPLEVPTALWIARQAAAALGGLHALGYLHGDVRPENLLFGPDGHVTLIDLTCAERIETEPTIGPDELLGALAYMAPERLAGQPATPQSDLYSLGIALFEMLSGRLPWGHQDAAGLSQAKRGGLMPSVRAFAPHVPSRVAQFVGRLCACHPLRRPSSAQEAVGRLMELEITTLTSRRWPA